MDDDHAVWQAHGGAGRVSGSSSGSVRAWSLFGMRPRVILVAFAATMLPWLCGTASSAGVVSAGEEVRKDPVLFFSVLSADEESAVVESAATGRAEYELDRATLKFTWKLTYQGLSSAPIAIAIHGPGLPGTEAVPIFPLSKEPFKSPVTGSRTLTDGELQYLLDGKLYVRIRTTKYPEGEIRSPIRRIRSKPPKVDTAVPGKD